MLESCGIALDRCRDEIRRMQAGGYSLIFVAVEQELAGIIALDDALRWEAARAISRLKALGIKKIIMLTGDAKAAAHRVARTLKLDECHAELFPEQKVAIIEEMKRQGYAVAMVGDGLNDGPALSCADVGISLTSGADLGREAADTILLAPRLDLIPEAVEVSRAAVVRAHRNLHYILAINTTLLALGMFGLISPAHSAFFHNISTVLLSLNTWRRRRRPSRRISHAVPTGP